MIPKKTNNTWAPGIGLLFRTWLRFREVGIVVTGHGLSSRTPDEFMAPHHDAFQDLVNTVDEFETLGFAFISMRELINIADSDFRFNRNWIHITFDDGYESIYTHAYPYLKEKKIPFSLYISTHHIEQGERYYTYRIRCSALESKSPIHIPGTSLSLSAKADRDERVAFGAAAIAAFKNMSKPQTVEFMTYIDSLLSAQEWDICNNRYSEDRLLTMAQVKQLANDDLVHIGSHNHNHVILNGKVAEEDILFEMKESRNWLQTNLGIGDLTYCYPNGTTDDFTRTSGEICRSLGYKLAFTAVPGLVSDETDRYEVPRLSLSMSARDLQTRLLKSQIPNSIAEVGYSLRAALSSVGSIPKSSVVTTGDRFRSHGTEESGHS